MKCHKWMGEAPEGSVKIKNKLIFILYNFLRCTARREGLTHFMPLVSFHTPEHMFLLLLTHFTPMFYLYIPLKHRKTKFNKRNGKRFNSCVFWFWYVKLLIWKCALGKIALFFISLLTLQLEVSLKMKLWLNAALLSSVRTSGLGLKT